MKMIVALAVLIACLIVQRMALHKAAFGRSLFILSMGFLTSIVVGISPYPPARFLSQALFWMTWGFILFMTAISLVRLRRRRS